jgi:hypothetical protein
MPHEFDAAAVAYREARSQCQVATGDALDTAQDLEAVAVEGLINTPSEFRLILRSIISSPEMRMRSTLQPSAGGSFLITAAAATNAMR